ncbi:MAG: hypothetical protein GX160_10370 [Clostridiales bacterium]|nr:hypothetical protein [Clostridiales bacterium]
MNEKQILESLKRTVDQAPIDILDKIKQQPRTKMLRHDGITRQDTATMPSFRKLMSYVSVAAMFLFMFFGWQYMTQMPDSHVYLDVNPSIEIVTNRQDKVINLKADNIDGQRIVEGIEYKGKTVYQVTEEILDRMIRDNYLGKGEEFLLLSVFNNNQERAEEQKRNLDQKIHEHLQAKELQPIVLAQKLDNTSTIERYAKEYGISVSKMTFIRNMIILNPELKTEALVNLSIGELVRLSQGMRLELDKIIDSEDLEKVEPLLPQQEPEKTDEIISPDQARSIALSVVKGTITDFDIDEDDLEYEVEIEVGELEYEIIIDAKTGTILKVEVDD